MNSMLRQRRRRKPQKGGIEDAVASKPNGVPALRMEDVARLAGVSVMTVSRALRTPPAVAASTLAKVRAALEETGYLPNLVASGLASSRTQVVAAVIPLISQPFAPTLQSMSDVLRRASYQLVLGVSHYDPLQEEALVRAFLSRRVDGIALFAGGHTPQTIAMLEQAGVPLVEMWADSATEFIVDAVSVPQRRGAQDVVRHLLARGRQRIGFIGGSTRHNIRAQARLGGYLDGLAEAGLPHDPAACEEATHFLMEGGAAALARLLERRPQLDAICVASDILAAGVVFEAHRRGLSVPRDLAVAGFDDAEIARSMYPALTTIDMRAEDMGRRAAEMLLERTSQSSRVDLVAMPSRMHDLGYTLIVREST
ncbi:LacI family DNA-binding transcriptional regulator [Belnapia moabensis]|uniref:LacI family DNA-binding transcriptional regulator n=1 Tax=Belnapia moabensis TaxID=365533 RepID=UPI0009FD9DB9|nr:LacI family DNA-binding transcriptional regulator [Belnapia moabensis]